MEELVFVWMISSNKQQTSAFLISAPAFRPQLVPASRPLPFPVLPPPCPPPLQLLLNLLSPCKVLSITQHRLLGLYLRHCDHVIFKGK